jgi:hypothetical protein
MAAMTKPPRTPDACERPPRLPRPLRVADSPFRRTAAATARRRSSTRPIGAAPRRGRENGPARHARPRRRMRRRQQQWRERMRWRRKRMILMKWRMRMRWMMKRMKRMILMEKWRMRMQMKMKLRRQSGRALEPTRAAAACAPWHGSRRRRADKCRRGSDRSALKMMIMPMMTTKTKRTTTRRLIPFEEARKQSCGHLLQ